MITYPKALPWTLTCLFLCLFGILLYGVFSFQEAYASSVRLDGADFDPGRIIDDDIFTDTSTMSAEEIQRFLEDNVEGGECDRYRENPFSETTSGPFTCLFEFQENLETNETNYGLFAEDGAPLDIAGGSTAAEIIWQAAQDHQINPQVLLVLLQKEQSLITDNWPWLLQFLRATGYQCPDNASCDTQSASFYKQVSKAAWQFRHYLDYTEQYWYDIGQNRILYNPDTSCGYQVVDIQNKATIALYLYTPYVPNDAALNNLFGQGDTCSAYGNRNFWSYFQRWFGPTTSGQPLPEVDSETTSRPRRITWSFNPVYQGVFTDSSQATALLSDRNFAEPGQEFYILVDFQNTGTSTWTQESGETQVLIAPHSSEEERTSWLCHTSWQENCGQVALMQQETVQPLQVATFGFWVSVPLTNGEFTESFILVNANHHLEGQAVDLTFEVIGASQDTDFSNPPTTPVPPASTDSEPVNQENTVAIPTSQDTGSTPQAILPDNWDQLNTIEKILLNPWGCHDTTQIRADNGQCLRGGYTIPGQVIADNDDNNLPVVNTPEPEQTVTSLITTPTQAILPDNWDQLNTIEKILLNPWGCHDTTQIRADNGQCLRGGYTIPGQVIADNDDNNLPVVNTPEPEQTVTSLITTPTQAILPDNWDQLNTIEKILLNPWGCHDTTQIRADNGQCLRGGYTIPGQIAITTVAANTDT